MGYVHQINVGDSYFPYIKKELEERMIKFSVKDFWGRFIIYCDIPEKEYKGILKNVRSKKLKEENNDARFYERSL